MKTKKLTPSFSITHYISEKKKLIDEALDNYLPSSKKYPSVIHEAMRYSVLTSGKRLRPILVLAAAETLGKDPKFLLPIACACELIHTYSLVHDDLPCIDNDDYRRGKPTVHKVYGEAIATLTGDALLTYAFYLFAEGAAKDPRIGEVRAMKALYEISSASGTNGLIGGQVVDIQSEGIDVNLPTLQYIHTHKTGALIRVCLRVGAILSKATPKELQALSLYGEYAGLAFQIVDDCLNISGDEKRLGKKVGSDAIRKKATYPKIFGLEESKKRAYELYEHIKESLKIFGKSAIILQELANYILNREK